MSHFIPSPFLISFLLLNKFLSLLLFSGFISLAFAQDKNVTTESVAEEITESSEELDSQLSTLASGDDELIGADNN